MATDPLKFVLYGNVTNALIEIGFAAGVLGTVAAIAVAFTVGLSAGLSFGLLAITAAALIVHGAVKLRRLQKQVAEQRAELEDVLNALQDILP